MIQSSLNFVFSKRSVYLIYIVISAFAFQTVQGQNKVDTIYYDKDWKVIAKPPCSFYRTIEKKEKLYEVNDYFANGVLQMNGTFLSMKDNMRTGPFKYYDSTGHLSHIFKFMNSTQDGEQIWYHRNNAAKRTEIYINGVFISGKCFDELGAEIPFFPYEVMPQFPGGDPAMMAYIIHNLKYPREAQQDNREGKVVVKFMVTTTGEIRDVEATQTVFPPLDREAVRMVKAMPNWIPGKQDGKTVDVFYSLPITFQLGE